jgi:hypothetical protein
VHVRGDSFRRMVVSGRDEMSINASPEALAQLDLRYRLGAAAADTYREAGFTVALQDVILGEYLPRYVSYIRTRPLHVIVLAPRQEVVAEREEARRKIAYGKGGFTIEELDRDLREATPQVGLWLDNSDQTPEQTVDEILARRSVALV